MSELELTPELREKLASFLPITTDGTFKYVPRAFREALPKEQWPVFTLKTLSGMELAKAEDMLYGNISGDIGDGASAHIRVSRGTFVEHVCKRGILDWKRYAIEFNGEESLKRLPKDLLYELTNAITENRHMSEEELRGLE